MTDSQLSSDTCGRAPTVPLKCVFRFSQCKRNERGEAARGRNRRSICALISQRILKGRNLLRPNAFPPSTGILRGDCTGKPGFRFETAARCGTTGCARMDERSHHLRSRHEGIQLSKRSREWNIRQPAFQSDLSARARHNRSMADWLFPM